jgi:hypothetical protein
MAALIGDIGFHAAIQFMALASVAGLIAGAMLIVRPGWLAQLGKYSNRWVSTRKLDSSLERWVSLDKWFYQHHLLSGSLMLAGALWVLAYFLISFDSHSLAAALSGGSNYPPQLVEGWLSAFVVICMGGAIFAVAIGFALLMRPSGLHEFDQRTNRWFSLRKTLKPAEVPRAGVDEYVFAHARLAGALLLAGSLYILVGLLFTLR